MFTSVQDKIITALDGLENNGAPLFRLVDVWQGDVEDLLKNAQKLPSANVILSGAEFDPSNIIGSKVAPLEMVWSVIIISQNLRDRKSGSVDSLVLINQVVTALTGLATGYGPLWPARLQFLGADNGKAAYGIQFTLEKGKAA